MSLTADPNDPHLTRGVDKPDAPYQDQAGVYLVLSEEERAKGFVRPVRTQYWHTVCGRITTMGLAIAETYARHPSFYGGTYCAHCGQHRPVGQAGEFHWVDTAQPMNDPKVGT